EMDVDGEPMLDEDEDVDGRPMDDDVDGEPMEEDIDGEPMDGLDSGASVEQKGDEKRAHPPDERAEDFKMSDHPSSDPSKADEKKAGKRRRPKAEDMFADSDEE
ncbi:MAG: hypothetical protein M1830_006770, partial [Pleopsidium flavum]